MLVAIDQDHLAVFVIESHLLVVVAFGAQPDHLLFYMLGQAPSAGILYLQAVDPAGTQALEFTIAVRIGTLAQHGDEYPRCIEMQSKTLLGTYSLSSVVDCDWGIGSRLRIHQRLLYACI